MTTDRAARGAVSFERMWVRRYRALLRPRANGLPNTRVLLAFPAFLIILASALVGLGLNGTSSGMFHEQIAYGQDPDLIVGEPQATRSDEWNVQAVWAIAQVQQGLPAVNQSIPGGMDTTLPQDLPRIDWTLAFRPHLWGYPVLGLDSASALRWWLPGLALMATAYAFMVSVLPRRPGVSAMFAIGFFFSPFFQWWFLASTLWTAAWALAVMAALVWAFRGGSRRSQWRWAVLVFYLTVVMAMGIYVPFIVPSTLVVLCFAVGLLTDSVRRGLGWKHALGRVAPILVAGVAASAVAGAWLFSKRVVVDSFLGTAYPGERSSPTGAAGFFGFLSAIASSFTQALNDQRAGILGPNSSEASTFFFLGLFLLPVAGWLIVLQVRRHRTLPWVVVGLVVAVVVLLAYLFVPGWDALSRLLLLDKTTPNRVRIGLGLASLGLLAYTVHHLDSARLRAKPMWAGALAAVFLLSQAGLGLFIFRRAPETLESAPLWGLWALLSAVAVFALARRQVRLGAIAFLIVTVAGSALTNPVYRGVLDLRETAVARAVMTLDAPHAGTWVGVGNGLTTAMLLESGVRTYNGFQGAPSREMWEVIDPRSSSELEWNRLAGVNWNAGAGEPTISNPAADQIMVTFDGCSAFAQSNVDFVLSDDQRLDTTCLVRREKPFDLPKSSMTIYQVVRG